VSTSHSWRQPTDILTHRISRSLEPAGAIGRGLLAASTSTKPGAEQTGREVVGMGEVPVEGGAC